MSQLTLDWQLINSTPSEDQLINQHSTACLQNLVDSQPTVDRDVDRVSTKVSIKYR